MSAHAADIHRDPTLHEIRGLVQQDFNAVNALIDRQLHSQVPLVVEIGRYIVGCGGKRLRPLIVLLAAKACNYIGTAQVKLAVLVEFLHTATLLHDDVVDASGKRRGKRTVNVLWGNAPSVLVGDFLYSRAFQLMVEIDSMSLMEIISHATNVIAEGEVLQLQNIGNTDITEEEYLEVIHFKTAMLFQAAAQSSATLAGSDVRVSHALRDFGFHFGMSYQLIDDWLDFAGDSEIMGKNVGDDLAGGKATIPLIYTMREGSPSDADCVRDAVANRSQQELSSVIAAVRASGALDYCKALAETHTQKCIECLQAVPNNNFREALIALAHLAMYRTY